MQGVSIYLLLCSAMLVCMCGALFGAPSGLNVIPTADVLDKGVVSLETESVGSGRPWGDGCNNFVLLQVGLGGKIEIGFDTCINHPDNWLNLKCRVCDENRTLPAFAIGSQSVSRSDRPQHYVVATKSFGGLRVHAGAIRVDGKSRKMVGLDHPLNKWLTFQGDYIQGDEHATNLGLVLSVCESLALTFARSIGNSTDSSDGYIVNLAWTRKIR